MRVRVVSAVFGGWTALSGRGGDLSVLGGRLHG